MKAADIPDLAFLDAVDEANRRIAAALNSAWPLIEQHVRTRDLQAEG